MSLSRNFGHQYAITAGMEYARGDAVIVMDADLQHPPELIPKMVNAWRSGMQVVYTVREDDEKASWFKRWTSSAFYKLMNCMSDTPIVPGAADFRLMDRTVVDALVAMPERSRFLRGMVSWLGFRQQSLNYRANPRFSGKSKYSLRRVPTLALQGMTSFPRCLCGSRLTSASSPQLSDCLTRFGQSTQSALPTSRSPAGHHS